MQFDTLYTRNTNPNLYVEDEWGQNCGSFALGVNGWYCPYIQDDDVEDELILYTEYERNYWIEEMVNEGLLREDIMSCLIERDFEFILKTCPWLEPIQEEEIDIKDRVIAYRLCMQIPDERAEFQVDNDMDFHFRVLLDGVWWEKNGAGPIHEVDYPENEIWEVEDFLVYDGEIKYARFKEDWDVFDNLPY